MGGGGASSSHGGEHATGGAGTGGDAACEQCMPEVLGWFGPMVFRLNGNPSACESPWSAPVLDGGDTPVADPQFCECNPFISDFTCAQNVTVLLHNTNPGCTGGIGTYQVPTTGCLPDGTGGAVNSLVVSGVATTSATCQSEPQMFPVAPWTWQQSALVCNVPNTVETCDGGLCVPDTPAGFQLCIYQAGDTTCPSEYPHRELIFTDVQDTRGCTCGPSVVATLGNCGVEVSLYGANDCATSLVGSATPTACTTTTIQDATVASIKATLDGTTTATCSASRAVSTGDMIGTMPHTVCCAN